MSEKTSGQPPAEGSEPTQKLDPQAQGWPTASSDRPGATGSGQGGSPYAPGGGDDAPTTFGGGYHAQGTSTPSPYGPGTQQPYGQQPGGPSPYGPPGQQYGQQYGQGPGQGYPGQGSGQYPGPPSGGGYNGPPSGPGGYGSYPGGPGGPGSHGPGGPGQGGSGSGGSGKKLAVILGACALVLLLVIGGVVAALTLTGGDSEESAESDESSQKSEGAESPSAAGSGSADASESESSDGDAAGSGETVAPNGSFTAESSSDVSKVCEGEAMENAAPYDSENPRVLAYEVEPGSSYISSISLDYDEDYYVDYDKPQDVSVVMCLKQQPKTAQVAKKCKAVENNKVREYDLVTHAYKPTFYEAATGKNLGTGDELRSSKRCPSFAYIKDGKSDASISSYSDRNKLSGLVENFEFE